MTGSSKRNRLTRRSMLTLAGAAALTLALPSRGRALVVGGGAAGAAMALALKAAQPAASVLLVERDPTRLSPVPATAFAAPCASVTLETLRAHGVEVLLDEVIGIDWRAARIALFSGRSEAFDRICVAPGTMPRPEDIPGLGAAARFAWPAAWGSAREARRLMAALGAMPERGHLVLRLPADVSHRSVAVERAMTLGRWLAKNRPEARMTVLDGSADPALKRAALSAGVSCEWFGPGAGGRVLSVDVGNGRIETDAGLLLADAVNFVTPMMAGDIAGRSGLTDASGWCPCDASGVSKLRAGALVLGDARAEAERTIDGALQSVRASLRG